MLLQPGVFDCSETGYGRTYWFLADHAKGIDFIGCLLYFIIEYRFKFERKAVYGLAQVLKDEIFERIFRAGVDVFYEKDYRSAKMQDIAQKAGIPVGLIYSYYKNKEALFNQIASSLPVDFEKIIGEEEQSAGLPSERYQNVAERYLLDLLEYHKIFVILMDKSQGTKFEDSKENMIKAIERHIKYVRSDQVHQPYHDMLYHILAGNFAESILEVARHYENRAFARTMLALVTQCYYKGVDSL